jgi:predicted transcriptional regulator of viral defense system
LLVTRNEIEQRGEEFGIHVANVQRDYVFGWLFVAIFNDPHPIDGVPVRIYSVARTIVDCFKYRNKLGLDVAIEALRFARARKRISNREILHFAQLLRQDRVMAPYLESVT